MQQRETFVLKMILSQDQTEKEFRAVLQSTRHRSEIHFNSIEKLTEYLKIWELQALHASGKKDERQTD
jgi:hypothetical protein